MHSKVHLLISNEGRDHICEIRSRQRVQRHHRDKHENEWAFPISNLPAFRHTFCEISYTWDISYLVSSDFKEHIGQDAVLGSFLIHTNFRVKNAFVLSKTYTKRKMNSGFVVEITSKDADTNFRFFLCHLFHCALFAYLAGKESLIQWIYFTLLLGHFHKTVSKKNAKWLLRSSWTCVFW